MTDNLPTVEHLFGVEINHRNTPGLARTMENARRKVQRAWRRYSPDVRYRVKQFVRDLPTYITPDGHIVGKVYGAYGRVEDMLEGLKDKTGYYVEELRHTLERYRKEGITGLVFIDSASAYKNHPLRLFLKLFGVPIQEAGEVGEHEYSHAEHLEGSEIARKVYCNELLEAIATYMTEIEVGGRLSRERLRRALRHVSARLGIPYQLPVLALERMIQKNEYSMDEIVDPASAAEANCINNLYSHYLRLTIKQYHDEQDEDRGPRIGKPAPVYI